MKRLGMLAILTAACLCPLYARAAGIPVSGRVFGPGGTSLTKAKVRLLPEVGPVATARMEDEGKQPAAAGHLFLRRREVRGTGASLRLERAAAADVTSSATEAGGEEAVDSAVRKAGASGAAPASGLPSARESQARQIPRPPRLERIEVVSAAGFPAAGVLVLAEDGEHPIGFTDARGLFEVVVSARGETPITLIAEDGRLLETRLRASEARLAAARGGAKAADAKPRRLTLPGRLAVSGLVIDAGSRAPVAGAFVWNDREVWGGAVTDASGVFTLSGPEEESVEIEAAAPEVGAFEARGPLMGLRVELAAAGRAMGIVRDAEHRPIPGVEATLRRAVSAAGPGGRRVMLGGPPREEFTASTDGEGRFVVTGIGGGRFDLTLRRAGYARTTVPGVDVVRAEGGGPAARATTSGSNAAASRRDAVDLGEFTMERGERIDGLVSGEDGAPLEGVKVRMRPGGGGLLALVTPSGMPGTGGDEPPPDGVTGSDGRFVVGGLRPGEPVRLSFEREGYFNAGAGAIVPPWADPMDSDMNP